MKLRNLFVYILLFLLSFSLIPIVEGQWSNLIIEVTTSDIVLGKAFSRKNFFSGEYHFVFYSNGSDMNYCYSKDGFVWSSPIFVRSGVTDNDQFSIFYQRIYEGDFVAYAFCKGGWGDPIYYRLGKISGYTISWGTEYLAKAGATDHYYSSVTLILGRFTARPWIYFCDYDDFEFYYFARFVRCTTKEGDGTWWEKTLESYLDYAQFGFPIIMDRKRVENDYYIWYDSYTGLIKGWLSEVETIDTFDKKAIIGVAIGYDIYLYYTYTVDGKRGIKLKIRFYDNASWSDAKIVVPATTEGIGGLTVAVNRFKEEIRGAFIFKYNNTSIGVKGKYFEEKEFLFQREPEDAPTTIFS